MNAIQQARSAYGGPQSPVRTPRQAEHQVLSSVTARLAAAVRNPGHFAALASALQDNRRLWTRFAADVAGKENGLPGDLRARLFYLAEFTNHHTKRVLNGEADAQALIDINTSVLRGLSGTSGVAAS